MYRQSWMDVFMKYNIPLPSCTAVERLSSMGSAILTAKRASLTSRHFKWLVFLKGNLGFLKWQGVAQNDFGGMPSVSRKQISCRLTNIFNLRFIV